MLLQSIITEVDIIHAAPSIWYSLGKIDKDKYEELINYPKATRVVKCGLMQKDDKTFSDALKEGYDKYIKLLKEKNNITDEMILDNVNDALWILDFEPTELKFDYVEFGLKRKYSMLYRYKKLSFYIDEATGEMETRHVRHLENSKFLKKIKKVLIDFSYGDSNSCYKILHKMRLDLEKDINSYGEPISSPLDINLKVTKHLIKTIL